MVVSDNIDSWVTINGELTQVTYFGQRQTCRHCREYLHIGATCVQNKKLLVQKTYADAAKQPARTKTSNLHSSIVQKESQQKQNSASMPSLPPKRRTESPKTRVERTTPTNNDQVLPLSSVLTAIPAFLKPPAPDSQPSDNTSISSKPTQPQTTAIMTRKCTADRNEGNDTDSSVASNSSTKRNLRGRPPGKKLRAGDNEREEEEKI